MQLQVKGERWREAGFETAEEAAMRRQQLIHQHGLPHAKPFKDEHYEYLVETYGQPRPRKRQGGVSFPTTLGANVAP